MKRKFMLQLSAVAFAVLAMVVLVACSSGPVSVGFSSQTSLAKAYLKDYANTVNSMDSYGEGTSYNDSLKFRYDNKFMDGDYQKLMKAMNNSAVKEIRAAHKAKMDGTWVVAYDDNGKVESRYKDEANKDAWQAFKNGYNNAKGQVKSYEFIKAELNAAETKIATCTNGLVTAVEVWTITYNHNTFKDGAKDTENKDATLNIKMYKIGSKWYTNVA